MILVYKLFQNPENALQYAFIFDHKFYNDFYAVMKCQNIGGLKVKVIHLVTS